MTIQADDPSQIGGYSHYFLIHMDAITPNIGVDSHVNQGDFWGWSGGQSASLCYLGASSIM